MLPQRGWIVWQRRARHHPSAPVSEGGTGKVRTPGALLQRARETHAQRRGGSAAARPALSYDGALHGRHECVIGEDVRYRSVASGAATLPRDFVVLEFRGVPGSAGEYSLSPR